LQIRISTCLFPLSINTIHAPHCCDYGDDPKCISVENQQLVTSELSTTLNSIQQSSSKYHLINHYCIGYKEASCLHQIELCTEVVGDGSYNDAINEAYATIKKPNPRLGRSKLTLTQQSYSKKRCLNTMPVLLTWKREVTLLEITLNVFGISFIQERTKQFNYPPHHELIIIQIIKFTLAISTLRRKLILDRISRQESHHLNLLRLPESPRSQNPLFLE
jgi:hypothetical protein